MKIAVWLLTVALLSAQAPPPAKQDVNYVVGPSDVLRVTVFNEPQLSGAFRIENDGSFSYPFLGRVKAGGLTVAAVASTLRMGLANGYLRNPQVTVDVDALAQAGSITANAGAELLILRSTSQALGLPTLPGQSDAEIKTINLREIEDGKLSLNVTIRDGDTIFIPKVDRFFVIGMVRNAGSYPLERNMTVLQAISTAGGISERGSNRRLKVLRIVNNKRTEISAKPTDIVQPGDTIVVPQRLL